MNPLVIVVIGFAMIGLILPAAYAEIYVHDRPSWSIEYPDGWSVEEDPVYDAVYFSDGGETSMLWDFGIWKNM